MTSLAQSIRVQTPGEPVLTPFDKCDGCGAQAFALARKPGHTELLFCGHHYREHDAMLLANGWAVTDQTSQIVTKLTE